MTAIKNVEKKVTIAEIRNKLISRKGTEKSEQTSPSLQVSHYYKRVMTAIQNGEKGVTIAEIRNKPPLIIRKGTEKSEQTSPSL